MTGAWVLAALWSCGDNAPPTAPASEAVEVLHAGCDLVQDGAACALEPGGTLTLWVVGPPVSVRVGERPREAAPTPVDGGTRYATVVEGLPTTLQLATDQGIAWSMPLVARPERPARPKPDPDDPDPCSQLAAFSETVAPVHRGWSLLRLAGCARTHHPSEALAHMAAAARAFDAAGQVSEAAQTRCALSSMLFGVPGSLGEIRRHLDAVPAVSAGEIRWGAAYHRGLLAKRMGDHRLALQELGEANRVASRLSLDMLAGIARAQEAGALADVGRFDEAEAIHRALVDDTSACDVQVEDLTALAWTLLLRLEASGPAGAPDPLPVLRQTEELLEACGDVPARANTLVNVALAAWHAGDHAGAREALDAVATLQPEGDPLYDAWVAELRSRLALAAGDGSRALLEADRLLELAGRRHNPDRLARARLARADALALLGRGEESLGELARGHGDLFRATELLPVFESRAQLLAARQRLTARYVEALLAAGRVDEALDVVRTTRSHVLRAGQVSSRIRALSSEERHQWDRHIGAWLDARSKATAARAEAWALSQAELADHEAAVERLELRAQEALEQALRVVAVATVAPPRAPAPGELLLAWFPLPSGWTGLWRTVDGTGAVALDPLPEDPDELAKALVAPFADAIGRAERVTLLPWGQHRALPLHLATVQGEPLAARVAVAYGLDVAPGPPRAPATAAPVVVADPSRNLPHARTEGDQVADQLGATVLAGAEATVAATRHALGSAPVLHFAGHARFSDGDASLELADGALRIGDILMAERVPERVVISACESGRSQDSRAVETWGLAQALVAAGAREAMASVREVDDAEAARVAVATWAAMGEGRDLAEAYHQAFAGADASERGAFGHWRVWSE